MALDLAVDFLIGGGRKNPLPKIGGEDPLGADPDPGGGRDPETQTHWGGYAPPDPPSVFFGTGGVQRHIF